MVKAFPNLTVIDVAAVMNEVRTIMDRVAGAVEFVFLFTWLMGFTVLYAAIAATRDERVYETAILRTLGASRRQLLAGLFAEFAGIGLLAGLVAALGASGTSYILSTRMPGVALCVQLLAVAGGDAGRSRRYRRCWHRRLLQRTESAPFADDQG